LGNEKMKELKKVLKNFTMCYIIIKTHVKLCVKHLVNIKFTSSEKKKNTDHIKMCNITNASPVKKTGLGKENYKRRLL
jgi:hypothetical protein